MKLAKLQFEKKLQKCIRMVVTGRYIVGYTVGNHILRLRSPVTLKQISDRISDDIPPQLKILNTVIPEFNTSASIFCPEIVI